MRTAKIEGEKFANLTVLSREGGYKNASWICVCDCGNETVATTCHLRSGHKTSCGCNKKGAYTHKMSRTKTYRSWKELRSRCNNPNSDKAKWYRLKGITVAPEWNSFEVFFNDMGERPEGTSIDRINPEWGYYPENCKWSTPKQQAETNSGCYVKGLTK